MIRKKESIEVEAKDLIDCTSEKILRALTTFYVDMKNKHGKDKETMARIYLQALEDAEAISYDEKESLMVWMGLLD